MRLIIILCCLAVLSSTGIPTSQAAATPTKVTIQVGPSAQPISPDLFGIFFEDINYAADGGLYAELVQNRSFEYTPGDNKAWNALTAWTLVQRGRSRGRAGVESADPIHPNNPHYAVITIEERGEGVGLANEGFDGIVVKAGDLYDLSLFARQLSGPPTPLTVRLESPEGRILSEAVLDPLSSAWKKHRATMRPGAEATAARLVVLVQGTGAVALDMISLFPQKTFRNRPNGLRADLAQVIADLKPRFIRFPGGCLAHGDGLDNMYRWKETIGPVEHRKAQRNIWRYHQTLGLGYFEYFQFCEDIGAKPLPVVPAGVCCQNAGHYIPGAPRGQQGIPLSEMPDYIQEVLDLIEWANGPATSPWGTKRAQAGHPDPFHLQYLGVGNEDEITPAFEERFRMIREAVQARHPDLLVIGTSGPFPDGRDFEAGWKFARAQNLDLVDEHYYRPPSWFWANLHRYDSYDRAGPKVYAGEYAAHDAGRRNTLRSALAEAAYLTSLERNGDVVRLASYAPLLSKEGRTQWRPDLIYFNNTTITPSVNYYVQQLFSLNAGDTALSCRVEMAPAENQIAEAPPTTIFLGTWNTQAEFDNVRVEQDSKALFQETFDQGTPRWQARSGSWELAAGAYRQQARSEPALSHLDTPISGPPYTLTLRARKTGGAEGFLIGFGATGPDDYYWWNVGGWGNTRHAVERSAGGAKWAVGASVPGRIEPNRWYDLKVEVAGQRIRCSLNDALIHDLVDDRLEKQADFAVSSVREGTSGDVMIKIVNGAPAARPLRVTLAGKVNPASPATCTVLTGDPMAENRLGESIPIQPHTSKMTLDHAFDHEAPPHSLTVIRIPTR